MSTKRMAGRDAFLALLLDEGVTHMFGNPGTTELAIMEAVPRFRELKYVLGLQESAVVAMADGFARSTGKLAACNLHCTPGLGHAMGAIYTAKFSGSPLIITAGQYPLGYGLQEPMLYDNLVRIAEPLVKWSVEVTRVEDMPRIFRRAAKIALTPPTGPVFISLPESVLDAEADLQWGHPSRVESATRPSDRLLQVLAERLLAANRPVIIAGRELANHGAFAQACELAGLLGAAVYPEPVPYNARFPATHVTNMGDLTRNQQKVRETLSQYDLLVCLGADLLRMSPYSPVDPLPDGLPVIHISERDWELGKNYPTEHAVQANVRETLDAILPLLRAQSADHRQQAKRRLRELAERNWNVRRQQARDEALSFATAHPIDQRYFIMRLMQSLPKDVIVVDETLTAAPAVSAHLENDDPNGYYGLASGGLGFALPGAAGISLGHPGRRVVAVVGDGSAMYGIQALWTAAHLKLPVTYIIINNRSYRIIKERLQALRGTDQFVAMDLNDPPIDFVSVARGFGMPATRVTEARAIGGALEGMMEHDGPQLLEVIVSDGYGG